MDSELTKEKRATQLLARVPMPDVGSMWSWGEYGGFADELGIPYDQQNIIAAKHALNDDRVSAAIKWLHKKKEQMFWRVIVCALDAKYKSKLADEVREFLEPPADLSLTNDNVSYVMERVKDLYTVSRHLRIPASVCRCLHISACVSFRHHIPEHVARRLQISEGPARELESDKRQSKAVGEYWRNTVPSAGWESLACVLYSLRENEALQRVKKFLHEVRDPTLNVDNIEEVMEGLSEIPDLDVPDRLQITDTFGRQGGPLSHNARICQYVYTHPCPSWCHIMCQLQDMGLTEAAKKASKYVKASETARRIINAAMKNGFTLRRDNKFLLVGPGGSGKSTLMARLLGLLVDRFRCSTNLAIHPVRTISVSRFSRRGRVWEVVDLNRLSDMVAGASLNPTMIEEINEDTSETHPSVTFQATVSHASKCSTQNETKVADSPRELQTQLVMPAPAPLNFFQKHMSHRVNRSQDFQNELVTDWIQLIDSGGQPQFHELASIFVKNLSGYISVFKLSEPLSHHGEVQFFINSNPINTPYACTYSNEGTIRCTMRAVQSQACKYEGRITKLAFVATHRDEDCSAEPLGVKNDRLHRMLVELLPENVRKGVISRGGSLKQVIFPFNGKDPDVHDEAVLEGLRTTLMDNPTGEKKMLPLKFHGLEIALLKLMQSLGRQVLSRQECLHVAVEIQFDEESFEVALRFLNDLNIIYYNREVLPGVVFGSSQVILDKLSEMVISSLRLQEDPRMKCRALDGKWRRFRDQGIISVEILKEKEFSTHYIAGLFTPKDVIRLLEKLLVVSHIGNDEYFLPSILVPSPQSRMVHPSELQIPSFAFYFKKGGPQVGVFCSQVSFLIRDRGWELLREDEEVIEVSRNCITFKVPGKNCPGKLTLIDEIANYIEVRLFMPPTYPKLQEKMQYIRDTLGLAFDAATRVHNFTDEQPEHAFMCPEQSEKCSVEAHPATVDESQTLLTCTIKPSSVFRSLTALHKKWLIPVAPSTGEKIHCTSSAAEPQASANSCLEMQELHKLSRGDKTVEDASKSQELHELSRGDKTVEEAASPNFHCTSSAAKAQASASACHDSNPELRELPQQSRGDKTVEEPASPKSLSAAEPQAPANACLDSCPELRELHILSRGDKTVRIRDGAASKWKDLAIQLNFQPGIINIIQSDSYYKSEDAFDMLMSRWLNGGGRHPVTWKTLIRALEDIDLNVLAQDVRQTLEVSYIATDTEDHHDSTHCCTLL